MRNLKFIALLFLSIASISPKFGIQNSRDISSVDCVNCELNPEISSHSNQVEKAVEKISKSIPKVTGNKAILNSVKEQQKCGNFFSENLKSSGRLKKDVLYHLPINDEMFADTDEVQNAFFMELVIPGRMKSTKEKKPFIGKSFEGDIFMVEQAYMGKRVVGYNITISFCSVKSNKGKDYISDKRELDDLGISGVQFGESSSCGKFNDIDSAQISMVSKGKGFFNKNMPFEKLISSIDCD